MKVYAAINAVQRALSKTGISKDRTNSQGSGYKFRGIDDVYNAVAPLLAEHALCIIPRMLTRQLDERQSKSGGALFYVTVEAEFDFVSAEDGSKHTARTFGEAMDSGDKATNKAMSAAYKYAAFQTFAIPTEGNPDADSETHEVATKKAAQPERLSDRVPNFPKVADLVMGDNDALLPEVKLEMDELAAQIKEQFPTAGPKRCAERIKLERLDAVQELYLSTLLPTPMRNAIKTASHALNQKETA